MFYTFSGSGVPTTPHKSETGTLLNQKENTNEFDFPIIEKYPQPETKPWNRSRDWDFPDRYGLCRRMYQFLDRIFINPGKHIFDHGSIKRNLCSIRRIRISTFRNPQ